MLSPAWFFVTPWTAARQAPLPMEFSRQEYWSGLPFPPPGDLPDSGTESAFRVSCVGRRILYHWATWEAPRLLQSTLNLALYEVPRILISWGFTGIKSKLEIHGHNDSWIWVTSSLHTVGRSGDRSPSWAAHRAHSSSAQLSSDHPSSPGLHPVDSWLQTKSKFTTFYLSGWKGQLSPFSYRKQRGAISSGGFLRQTDS